MLSGGAMFFIRYNWTLPVKAQFAIAIVLLAVLGWMHGSNAPAKEFATLHQKRCVQERGAAGSDACATRTIQLALQMHGAEFGGRVSEVLR
jgi:hypothetical protein